MAYKPTMTEIKELRERTGAGIRDCKLALVDTEGNIESAIDELRKKGIAKAAKKSGRAAAEGRIRVEIDGNRGVIVEVNCETDFVGKTDEFLGFVGDVAKHILNNNPSNVEDLKAQSWDQEITVEQAVQQMVLKTGENIQLRRFAIINTENNIFSYVHTGDRLGVLGEYQSADELEDFASDLAMHIVAQRPQYILSSDIPTDVVSKEHEIQSERIKADPKFDGKPEKVLKGALNGRLSKWKKSITLMDQAWEHDDSGKVSVTKAIKELGTQISVVSFHTFELGEGIEKKESNLADEVAEMMK
jgi:elongation factor Ts